VPVLIDAEPDHFQLDVARVIEFLAGCERTGGALRNPATGRRVAAIVPVHVVGHPVDMDPLLEAAREVGLPVIEDATESLGSTYRGRPTGALGTLGCFSFNGNKIITTGAGGMIVTDDVALARRARHLTTQAKQDAVEFVHDEVGFNYRLGNVQAAIGVAQLERLDDHVAAKHRIGRAYDEALARLPGLTLPRDAAWAVSNRWLYTVRIDPADFGIDSRALMRGLGAAGIEARPLWQPMHLSPAQAGAVLASPCAVAERVCREALSLPCSVGLTTAEQARVIETIGRLARA
jgi:perosamine synthetase